MGTDAHHTYLQYHLCHYKPVTIYIGISTRPQQEKNLLATAEDYNPFFFFFLYNIRSQRSENTSKCLYIWELKRSDAQENVTA